MNAFSVVLTVAVLLAIAVFILLFERSRAREIEHDLGEQRDLPDGAPRHRLD
jgi:hypothetical protein